MAGRDDDDDYNFLRSNCGRFQDDVGNRLNLPAQEQEPPAQRRNRYIGVLSTHTELQRLMRVATAEAPASVAILTATAG